MTVTAKVKKRMIDNGRLVHAIVQGESNATTIVFRIEGEADLVASESLYLYLLYKRPNDQTVQLPILLDYTIEDGVIVASFTPGAYFTAQDGVVEISIIATESTAELGGSGEVTNTLLWSSFPAWLIVASSQLADSSTIIEENVFTQYLAELEALDSEAKDYASDAEEFAKGTRSDGGTVTHATDNAKYYKNLAKDWAMKTGGPVEGVEMSAKVYAASSQSYATESQQWANKMDGKVLGTDYSSKYYASDAKSSAQSAEASADIVSAHAAAIDAIGDDLTNIDAVATDIQDDDSVIDAVAQNLTAINAVANNETNINAVNSNKTNIDAVAGVASNVTTVAGIASDVTTVAGISTDVEAVADIDDDVSDVASIKTDVSAVAAVASDVSAVADDLTNIDAVNSNKTNIDTVAGISSDVSAVAAIDDEIQAVEDALQDIADVATDLNDEDSAIKAVASDMTGVSAVAADLDNIDAVAADLANIDAADEHALEAEGWANGTQNGTPVSSGSPYYENNAKYWADAVPNLNDAISQLDHRLENIEQSKGDYVVNTYKDGSTTPSGKGKWCVVEGVEGVSRCENNLSDIADGTFSENGNVSNTHTCTFHSSHFYLVSAKVVFSGTPTGLETPVILGFFDLNMATYQRVRFAYNASNTYSGILIASSADGSMTDGTTCKPVLQMFGGNGVTEQYSDVIVTDLNVYFGTTDLSFLGATDSAKLATIQTNYPHLLIPSDYGTRIVDWTGNGVRAWARNLWDEEWEIGAFDPQGEKKTGNYIISKNLIPVSPNTTYYSKAPASMWVREYDREGTYLGIYKQGYDTTFTTSAQTYYVSLELYGNAPYTTYGYNICLNVSDSQNGTYTPYWTPRTLTFPSPISLKSAGAVADTMEPCVEVKVGDDWVYKRRDTQNVDSVDCTTLTWSYNSTYDWWSADYSSGVPFSTASKNCFYHVGIRSNINNLMGNTAPGYCMNDSNWSSTERIYIRNGSSTTPPDGYFYYESPNPTVTLSAPILDNTLLTEAGGRMATVQTGTVVDGSFDMGFITL